jgi:ligand-binding sensor domain-containing protein/serine phosphatase RsbU (regulator of sigma subunit)
MWCIVYAGVLFLPFHYLKAQKSYSANKPTTSSNNHYIFKSYGVSSGISNKNVTCFEEDKTGFLWIGTHNGLNRFDGLQYTVFKHDPSSTFSLPDNHVNSLFGDAYGNLWVGTKAGLAYFETSKSRFRRITLNPMNLREEVVQIKSGKKGEVLVATTSSVYAIMWKDDAPAPNVKQLANVDEGDEIKNIKLHNGKLTLATEYGVQTFIYEHTPENIELSKMKTCAAMDRLFTVHSLEETPDGNLLATTSNGIYLIDKETGCLQQHPNANDLKNANVRIVHFLPNKEVFVVTTTGLYVTNHNFSQSRFLKPNPLNPDAVPSSAITSIYTDSRGIVWLGYENHGFSKWDRLELSFINFRHLVNDEQSLPGAKVNALLMDKRQIFAGTNGGVSIVDIQRHIYRNLLKGVCVFDLLWLGDGTLLAATDKGIRALDTARLSEKYFGSAALVEKLSEVCVMRLLKDGNILTGTKRNGLFWINKKSELVRHVFEVEDPQQVKADLRNITALYEDNMNDIWVGTNHGLFYFSKNGTLKKWYTHISGDVLSLPSDRINYINQLPGGDLLVATEGGGLALKAYGSEDFSNFNREGGFPSDNIKSVMVENREWLWLGTDAGLLRFNHITKDYKLYNESAGICSEDFIQKSACKSVDGKLAFGTNEGFTIFDPEQLKNVKIRPRVLISSLRILDKPFQFNRPLWQIKELRLNHKENTIYFGFTSIQFTLPTLTRYYYKLEGVDADWNEAAGPGMVNYSNLDHGSYTFKVKALSDGLSTETSVASLIINIKPPFWRQGWFKALSFLCIILSALLFFQMRIRSIEYQKKALERLVDLRTNELKEKNSKILQQSDQLNIEKDKLDKLNAELEMMVEELESTLEKSYEQSKQIEESTQKILDSLHYARRIQKALLPCFETIKRSFEDVFILYEPKDIVSGDFYWFTEKNGRLVLAAVDCTGHGVPGAFMSLIGNDKLNRAVNEQELLDPRHILEYVEYSMYATFKETDKDATNTDGMEMSICTFDYRRNKFLYAGAHRPVYYVRNGQLTEVKGKPYGIGGMPSQRYEKVFETEELPLQKGDMLYMFTDGFVGQFNGETGKKYMSSRFKEFLAAMAHHPCEKQKELLSQELVNWLKGGRQTDDVMVIGVRI